MKFEKEETTTTIGELKVGDFIVVVPTQERMQGVKFDSGIKSISPQLMKRGRKEIVPGSKIMVHRTPVPFAFPNHFTVKVRRMIEP
jgi:hypothetical protein